MADKKHESDVTRRKAIKKMSAGALALIGGTTGATGTAAASGGNTSGTVSVSAGYSNDWEYLISTAQTLDNSETIEVNYGGDVEFGGTTASGELSDGEHHSYDFPTKIGKIEAYTDDFAMEVVCGLDAFGRGIPIRSRGGSFDYELEVAGTTLNGGIGDQLEDSDDDDAYGYQTEGHVHDYDVDTYSPYDAREGYIDEFTVYDPNGESGSLRVRFIAD